LICARLNFDDHDGIGGRATVVATKSLNQGYGMMVSSRKRSVVGKLSVEAAEDIDKTIEKTVGDKYPHSDEGDELDHGLQGDGGHQPFMALRCVQTPRPEQDAEKAQEQGNDQGRIHGESERGAETLEFAGDLGRGGD
jgi:hypothetical protein